MNNTGNIKDLLKRAGLIEDQIDSLKEEKKDLASEIKASGLKPKEFRATLKQIRKPLDAEFTATVNSYLSEGGQGELFA